jgi:hypothetical protein
VPANVGRGEPTGSLQYRLTGAGKIAPGPEGRHRGGRAEMAAHRAEHEVLWLVDGSEEAISWNTTVPFENCRTPLPPVSPYGLEWNLI